MPRRTLVELLHLAAGLMATALITRLAIWSYPIGRETLVWVGWGSAAVVLLMAAGPVLQAWRKDGAERPRDAG